MRKLIVLVLPAALVSAMTTRAAHARKRIKQADAGGPVATGRVSGISSRVPVVGLLGCMALLTSLALAPTASATVPGRNGLVAFQAQTAAGIQLFTMRPNGHDLRQLTHVDGDATVPDWSPDGRQIAFAFNECSVAVMDAAGGNLKILPPAPGDGVPGIDVCEGDPSFTPDGSRLVFVHFDAIADVEQVWSMKLDGSDRQVVTGDGAPDPNVSPDGKRLSFKGPAGALFVEKMDGTGLVQVSPTIDVAFKHDWAPDGGHLVFSDFADPDDTQPVNIATVRPDGSDLRYLTHYQDPRFRAYVGSYSPDGQWIIFRLEDAGLFALYRIRPDGSDLHQITPLSTFRPRSIDWGPAPAR